MERSPRLDHEIQTNIKTESGALKKDWLEKQGVDLEKVSFSELKEYIRKFYEENKEILEESLEAKGESLESELSALSSKKIEASRIPSIREKLGLPKKVPLAETVAFIKTLVDTDDQQIKDKYFDYCAEGISLDDMRRVLAFENDVKPARLDTDIYHQSPQRSRSAVEIVSNAIDALKKEGNTIGRFGVGFYQILSHLENENDYVKVDTGDSQNGFYTIQFSLKNKEIQIQLDKNDSQTTSGTTVELYSEEFPKEEAEALVKKHFAYNNVAEVFCNGKQVNDLKDFNLPEKDLPQVGIDITKNGYRVADQGVGMSPQVILEKLIVPKFSGKQSVKEILDKENINASYFVERRKIDEDNVPGKTVLNVGGVMIEEIEVTGLNTAKTVVVDLPPFTMLGEERNEVAVDEITITAIKQILDSVIESNDIEVLNSLAPIIEKLQSRSLQHEEANNLMSFMQNLASEKLPKNKNYLPNAVGFDRVEAEDVILVDPNITQTHWNKVPGFSVPPLVGSGKVVYTGPLNPEIEQPIIKHGNRVLLDSNVYEAYKNDPTLLNLYFETHSLATGENIRKIKEYKEASVPGNAIETKDTQYADLQDFIVKEWQSMNFPTLGTAKTFYDKLHDRPEALSNLKLAEKYFVNNFPKNLVKYILSQVNWDSRGSEESGYDPRKALWVNDETFKNILTLNNNPELVTLLDELDINVINQTDKKSEKYPNFNPKPKPINHPSLLGWDLIYYNSQVNLIDPEGKMYHDIKPLGIKAGNKWGSDEQSSGKVEVLTGDLETKWDVLLFKRGDELWQFDPKTKTQELIVVTPEDYKAIRTADFGDMKIIVSEPSTGGHSKMFEGLSESFSSGAWSVRHFKTPKYLKLYDLDKKEAFDPRPDLGLVEFISEDIIIYAKFGVKRDGKTPVNYTAFYPDGHTQELVPKEPRGLFESEMPKGSFWEVKKEKNKTLFLLNGEEVSSFPVAPYLQKIEDRRFRHLPDLEVDYFIRSDIQAKEFTQKDKSFLLYRYMYEDKSKDIKIGSGNSIYLHLGKEAICNLYDDSGELIYEGPKNTYTKLFARTDGNPVLLQIHYNGDEIIKEGDGGLADAGAVKEVIPFDLEGKEIENKEELKGIPPIKYKVGENWRISTFGDEGFFSLYQGESWKIDFKEHKNLGNEYEYRTISILDKTGQALFPYDFRSVIYQPEKDQWRCTVWQTVDMVFGGEYNDSVEKIIIINSSGEVVDEYEYVDRHGTPKEQAPLYNSNANLAEKNQHPLTPEKTNIMHRLLSDNSGEGKVEIERFVGRCFNYGDLTDKSFAFIAPVILKTPEIHPALITEENIRSLEGRITKYDLETKVWFYHLLSRFLPDEADNIFIEKFVKIFENKIAHLSEADKQAVFDTLENVRDYRGDYLTTGWNIVKSKTPVPTELIPEKVRPIVDFLRSNEGETLTSAKEEIGFKEGSPLTLSQLIQTKRLNETKIQNFSGSVDDLAILVSEKTSNKKQDHIKREIIHPIYYQGVNNPYLFIRELVQNAHDAVIVDPKASRKDVAIDLFSRAENEITFRLEDGAGMSLQELLNYFLIPGESTKIDSNETIGYFGQGLFTLFRGSKEVILKTGKGDGVIQKLKISPKFGADGGVEDLDLLFEQESGDFKGTTIERTVETDYPTVESSYIKNAVCTYTSLVESEVIDINLNGVQVNGPQNILSKATVPGVGDLKIIDAPNNVITQRGLYVKGLDHDYSTKLTDVEKLLKERGIVISIPDELSLTRSRNEIAQKEKVLSKIQEYLPALKVKAYLEIFRQDIVKGQVIQLSNLPYDFFYRNYGANQEIESDAKKISNGEPLEDVGRYLDRGSLIHLLVLLPAIELDGKTWSITELKKSSLSDSPPLEKQEKYRELPAFLRDKLLEGKSQHDHDKHERSSAKERGEVVSDFTWEDLEKQPEFIKQQIQSSHEQYKRLVEWSERHNELLATSYGESRNYVKTTFYSEPGSKAHAGGLFSILGWNLDYWRGYRLPFKDENPSDKELSEFLHAYTHEFTHIREKSGHMTHNQDFYLTQAKIICRLMELKKVAK